MATVQKGSKINFYKFVTPPSGGQTDPAAKESNKIANSNLIATNRLGESVNGIAKLLSELKTFRIEDIEERKKNEKNFKPEYTKPKKKKKGGLGGFLDNLAKGKAVGFLEGLLGAFGKLFKTFVMLSVLKWMADPANRKKLTSILEGIGKFAKFVYDVVKFGFVNTIEGLYKLLSDESSWWDKLLGFGQAIIGIGTLFLTMRWLSNPLKLITDFGSTLKLFAKGLKGAKLRLLKHPLVLAGLAAGAIVTTVVAVNGNKDDAGASAADEEVDKTPTPKAVPTATTGEQPKLEPVKTETPPERAEGGVVERAGGGWINGPQSGYPVSMDGGKSTAFIGHGLEYVAQRSQGGFVIPFDTPATRRQPHLTQKRMGEAQRGGYLQGFEQGGKAGSNKILDFMKNTGDSIRSGAQSTLMNVAGLFPGGKETTLKSQIGLQNMFGIPSGDLVNEHNSLVSERMRESGADEGKIQKKLLDDKPEEKQSLMDKLSGVPGLGWLGRMLGGKGPDEDEDAKKKKEEEKKQLDLSKFLTIQQMRGATDSFGEDLYNQKSNPSMTATSASQLIAGTDTESIANSGDGRDGTFGTGTAGAGMPSNPQFKSQPDVQVKAHGGLLEGLRALMNGGQVEQKGGPLSHDAKMNDSSRFENHPHGSGSVKQRQPETTKLQEFASGGKIKAMYTTGAGTTTKLPMGKQYSYSDFLPHHHSANKIMGYGGYTAGTPKDYNFSNTSSGDPWPSSGKDVAVPTPVAGKVLYRDPTGSSGGYGNTILLKTEEGNIQFSHMHSLGNFKVGDDIKAGTIIGGQGDTATDGQWHVHMNAPAPLHEKFINFISSGKATSGGSSDGSPSDTPQGEVKSAERQLLLKMMLAEAQGEGEMGMALVARAILNRGGLIQSGTVGAGMFNAKSGSLTDVMYGSGQFQPITDGSIKKPRSKSQLAAAEKALAIAQNTADLRGRLEASGMSSEQINYLVSATGFRTGDAFNDASQNVNVVKFKNHVFNTAGNPNINENFASKANIKGSASGAVPGGANAGSDTESATAEFDLSQFAGSVAKIKGATDQFAEERHSMRSPADAIANMAGSDLPMVKLQQQARDRIAANKFGAPDITPMNFGSAGSDSSSSTMSDAPDITPMNFGPADSGSSSSTMSGATAARNAEMAKSEDGQASATGAAIQLAANMEINNQQVASSLNQQQPQSGGGGGSSSNVVLPPQAPTTVNRMNSFVNPLNNFLKS